jgi:lipopolysaccharide export LptBFGC system permease protein LptF
MPIDEAPSPRRGDRLDASLAPVIRTLDRYIFRELTRTFAITLAVITFVFFIGTMFRLMRDELTYWQILRVLPYAVPFTLPYTLPLAFIIALTLTYGRLIADREVVALQSCGVSPRATATPGIVFAILLALGSLVLQADYLPHCHKRKMEIQRAALEQMLALGDGGPWSRSFPQQGFDIFIQRHEGSSLHGVVINRQIGGDPVTLTSESGDVAVVGSKNGGVNLKLSLQTVTVTAFDRTEAPRGGPVRARMGSYVDELAAGRGRVDMNDFTNVELRRIIDARRPGFEAARVELASRLVGATAPIIFLLLGLPLTFALEAKDRLVPFAVGVAAVSVFYFAPLLLGRTLAERTGGWPGWIFLGDVFGVAGMATVPLARRLANLSIGRRPAPAEAPPPLSGPVVIAPRPSLAPSRPSSPELSGEPRRFRVATLGILDRWILRRFAVNYAAFLGTIVVVFVVTDSLNKLDRFMDDRRQLAKILFDYYCAMLPEIYYMLAPFLTLAATLWVIFELRRHNELAPLMAAGVSTRRVCAPMFGAALLLAGVMFVDREVVIPSLGERRRASSKVARYEQLNVPPIPDSLHGVLTARSFAPRKRELVSPTYTRLDATGREVFTVHGARATPEGEDGWLFHDGFVVATQRTSDGDADTVLAIPSRGHLVATDIEVLDVQCAIENATYLSTEEMERQYRRIPSFRYLGVQLARRYSYPLAGVVLLVLGLPFVLEGERSAALFGVLACIGLGVLYFVTTLFCEDLGSRTGGLDPTLAVWFPVVLFGAPGAWRFFRRVR